MKFIKKLFFPFVWVWRKYIGLWRSKKWIFILLTGIVIFGGGYIAYKLYQMYKNPSISQLPIPEVEPTVLMTGDIVSSIKLSGISKLENEQTLKFAKSGKITSVDVKAGQKVEEGQVLASLDQSEIMSRIQEARTRYNKASRSLQDLLDGKDDTEILSAEYNIQSEKLSLDAIQDDLKNLRDTKDDRLKKLQLEFDQAQVDYEINKQQFALEEEIAKKKLGDMNVDYDYSLQDYVQIFVDKVTSAREVYFSLDKTLGNLDQYLGVSGKYADNLEDKYIYFSARDESYKNDAKWSLNSVYSHFDEMRKLLDSMKKQEYTIENLDTKGLLAVYRELKDIYVGLETVGEKFTLAAKNSITSVNFTQEEIDALETLGKDTSLNAIKKVGELDKEIKELEKMDSLSIFQADKKIKYLEALQAYQNKKNTLEKLSLAFNEKKVEYNLAKKNLERELIQKELDVKKAQNSYKESLKKLEEIRKGYTPDELQNARDAVADARKALEATESERDAYYLKATFNGTVRRVDMQVGDNLLENNDKSIIIENRDMIKIEMNASQSDILKIKVGQTVSIAFDAFPDVSYTGSIIEVDETPQRLDNVVKYKVVASIMNTSKTKIFSDMSAVVDIYLSKKEGSLILPLEAVAYDDSGAYVISFLDGKHIPVTVGEDNGTQIEILSGLDMGIQVKSSAFDHKAIEDMGISQEDEDMGFGGGSMY